MAGGEGRPRQIIRPDVGTLLRRQRLVRDRALEITVLTACSFDFCRDTSLVVSLAPCLADVRLLPELPGDTKSIDF